MTLHAFSSHRKHPYGRMGTMSKNNLRDYLGIKACMEK